MKTAELINDSSEKNADLYYATRFPAPDPYTYFKIAGRKYILINDLEIDRAKKNAKVDAILSLTKYTEKTKRKKKDPTKNDVIDLILKEKKVKKLILPENTSFVFVDDFRKRGYRVSAGPVPFYKKRLIKTPIEKKYVIQSQRAVFSAMRLAENILRSATIRKNLLYYKGKILTSEIVRDAIQLDLYKKGLVVTDGTIVACANDSIDPHNFGSGPLRPHRTIIVDIFPKSTKTLFFGDATRTFCKGRAPVELKRLYNTVRAGQIWALGQIKAGINGRTIHEGILKRFEEVGYTTGEKGGRMQGFFHSTGHGIGLELHEPPLRIGPVDQKLKEGYVMSVEPGLYYKNVGGVRIEDLVYITKRGCEVLASYPKRLEIE